MKFSRKTVKKLAVIGMLVLSAGALAACSNNLPSAKKIINQNKKFKDYNNFEFNIQEGYTGKKKESLSAKYIKKTRAFYASSDSKENKSKIWVPDDQTMYVQMSGVTVKGNFAKSKTGASQVDSMDTLLNNSAGLLSSLADKNLDWKVSETDNGYVLETSTNNVNSIKYQQILERISIDPPSFDENSKVKHLKIKFVVGKKNFDTKQAKLSFDLVSHKTYHFAMDFKFNCVNSIKVPSYIKENAIGGTKYR